MRLLSIGELTILQILKEKRNAPENSVYKLGERAIGNQMHLEKMLKYFKEKCNVPGSKLYKAGEKDSRDWKYRSMQT